MEHEQLQLIYFVADDQPHADYELNIPEINPSP